MGNMLLMQCTNVACQSECRSHDPISHMFLQTEFQKLWVNIVHTQTSLTKGFCAIIMWSTSCVMDNHSFL